MKCDICEQNKTINKDIFNCDGCSKPICRDCGNLTTSEIKVLNLTSRVLKFYCEKCRSGELLHLLQNLISSKNETIEDKMIIIGLLRKEIEEIKMKKASEKLSYSQTVKKLTEEVIIVKPKNSSQTSERTKKNIEEKVNPCELGVGVSRIKYIRDGGIAIKCCENKNEKLIFILFMAVVNIFMLLLGFSPL